MGGQSSRGLELARVGDVESVDALPVGVESAYENGVAASVAEAYVGRGLGARPRGSRARFRTSGARWNAAHPPAGRCHDLPKAAQRRLDILCFWDTHGLEASRDAFGVSRRTLYRWKQALKDAGGNPAALAAKSSAPKHRRTPTAEARRVSEIRRLRRLCPNRGKEKLRCEAHGIRRHPALRAHRPRSRLGGRLCRGPSQ
jgi:transposase-like protein